MNESKPDIKHWLAQSLPPLVLLTAFFYGDGNLLWYWASIGSLVGIICLISILYSLIKFSEKKYFLLRPALCLFFIIILYSSAIQTYDTAFEEAQTYAEDLQNQCIINERCPRIQPEGDTGYVNMEFGKLFSYPARFTFKSIEIDGKENEIFILYIYIMNDTGAEFIGGKHLENISIKRYPGE